MIRKCTPMRSPKHTDTHTLKETDFLGFTMAFDYKVKLVNAIVSSPFHKHIALARHSTTAISSLLSSHHHQLADGGGKH